MLIFYEYSIIQLARTKLWVYLRKLLWKVDELPGHLYLDFRLIYVNFWRRRNLFHQIHSLATPEFKSAAPETTSSAIK